MMGVKVRSLRRAPEDNLPFAISHLQDYRPIQLNRVLFTINANDKVSWRSRPFNVGRRGRFAGFRDIRSSR